MDLLALSQAEFGHSVLQDTVLICMLGVVFASIIHTWLRKSAPELGWNTLGKVNTTYFGGFDAAGAAVIALFYAAPFLVPYQEPKSADQSIELLIISFGLICFVACCVLFVFKQRSMLPEAMGLTPKHPAQIFSWAVGIYLVFALLYMSLVKLGLEDWLTQRLGEKENQQIVDEMLNSTSLSKQIVLVIGACVIAPFAEEVIFRGYIYPVIKRYTEPVAAMLFSGILFGAIHGQVWALIPLSLFGILLAVLYEITGSIWACMICHAIFNCITTYFMLTNGDQL